MARLASFLLCLFIAKYSSAKVVNGTVSTRDNWRFLTRFCFFSKRGTLNYDVQYPSWYAVQNIYLYYDSPTQWKNVYKTGKTCAQKEAVLKIDNNQIINLTNLTAPGESEANCHTFLKEGKQLWFRCTGERRFISARERWWYIAFGNCNTTKGLYLDFHFSLTNYGPEDIWFYQFSADEHYILPTDITFLVLETLVLVLGLTVAIMLRARQMFHGTYKLYLVSVSLECLSLISDCIASGQYAQDGVGLPWLRLLGQLLRAASTLTFLFCLILIGKGWTVTRGRLSSKGAWKILFFMCTYMFMYMALFVWQIRGFDPGKVLYLYESPAGYGIIMLRLSAWAWFCYAVYFTLVHYPEKRNFYYPFSAVSTLWFWMAPIIILVCNHLLDNWMREKIANGIENAVALFGFLAFMFITRPSAANTNFPYHVRTTQIESMAKAQPDSARSIDLPHNAYEAKYTVFTVGAHKEHDVSLTKNRKPSERHLIEFDEPMDTESTGHSPPPSYEIAVAE